MDLKDKTLDKDKRKAALRELFEDERTYVGNLNHFVEDLYEPLTVLHEMKGSGMFASYLSPEQLAVLYGEFPKLLEVHRAFLDSVENALHGYKADSSLSKLFENLLPKLSIYVDYVDSIVVAAECYNHYLSNRKDFAKFVKEEKTTQKQYSIEYLDMVRNPRGRLEYYVTILKALHKYTEAETEEGQAERERLKKCGTALKDLDLHIGGVARDPHQGKLMAEASFKLHGGPVITPHRTVRREGLLTKVSRKAVQKRFFMLFNDALMWAAPGSKNQHKFKGAIEDIGTAWIQNLEDTKQFKNGFQIVCKDKTYTLAAESPAEKKAWIQDINSVIAVFVNNNPALADQRAKAADSHKGSGMFKVFTLKKKEVVATNKDHTLATPTPQKEREAAKKAPGQGDADSVNRDHLRLMGALVITAEENRANSAQGPNRGGVVRAGAYGEAERRGKQVDLSGNGGGGAGGLTVPVQVTHRNSVSSRSDSSICRVAGCAKPRAGGYYCAAHAAEFGA